MSNLIQVKEGFGIYGMINNLAQILKKVNDADIPTDEIDQKMKAMRSELIRIDMASHALEDAFNEIRFQRMHDYLDRISERLDMLTMDYGAIEDKEKPNYRCIENVIYPENAEGGDGS